MSNQEPEDSLPPHCLYPTLRTHSDTTRAHIPPPTTFTLIPTMTRRSTIKTVIQMQVDDVATRSNSLYPFTLSGFKYF